MYYYKNKLYYTYLDIIEFNNTTIYYAFWRLLITNIVKNNNQNQFISSGKSEGCDTPLLVEPLLEPRGTHLALAE